MTLNDQRARTARNLFLHPVAIGALLLGSTTFMSCASTLPPFSPPIQGLRGFKSRTFRGTAEELRPAVVETLRELGFEVHSRGDDLTFLSGNRGMGAAAIGDRREWTRVGVQVRQVDMHRRAPRTLVEIDAETIQGSAEGAIEASFGSVPSTFYEDFFRRVDARAEALRPRPVTGFLLPR